MHHALHHEWRNRVARQILRPSVAFEKQGLVLGMGTVLFAEAGEGGRIIAVNRDADHDRLIALLAVAGGGHLAKDSVLHVRAALDEWGRGDKALAAIRFAFARLPRLNTPDDAYPLFLAEAALDLGLTPHDLARELGFENAVGALLKGDGSQPRVPKGSGRASGQYTSGQYTSGGAPPTVPVASVPRSGRGADPKVVPVFLDTAREHDVKGGENGTPPSPRSYQESLPEGHVLDGILPNGPALPLPGVRFDAGNDEKDGPDCPAMRPDRANGLNVAGDMEEARVAQIINPGAPTPKATPANPDTVSMAYYLPVSSPTGEIAIDDCKRGAQPIASIPDMRKGDMVEVKTAGAAAMVLLKWEAPRIQFEEQLRRQIEAITLEGKGRRLFTCVGTESNVDAFKEKLSKKYKEANFIVCK